MNRHYSVSEAARLLGISEQRIRNLLVHGQLRGERTSAGWIISADDLEGHVQRPGPGRRHSATTAWAVMGLLDHRRSVDRRHVHRARRIVAEMPPPQEDPAAWRRLLAPRAKSHHYWVHPGAIARLKEHCHVAIGGGRAAADLGYGISPGVQIDAYVSASRAATVVQDSLLEADPRGAVNLHVVSDSIGETHWRDGRHVLPTAVAADLLDQVDDKRAERIGINVLAHAFESVADL